MISIDKLKFRVLELQRELDEQEERDKDFIMLQRLAEEEVMTNTQHIETKSNTYRGSQLVKKTSLLAFPSLISDNVNHHVYFLLRLTL